jgi:hypothetical protein
MGKFFFFRKIYFWSYCNETSQERSLGCVDVLLGFDTFKMAAVAASNSFIVFITVVVAFKDTVYIFYYELKFLISL